MAAAMGAFSSHVSFVRIGRDYLVRKNGDKGGEQKHTVYVFYDRMRYIIISKLSHKHLHHEESILFLFGAGNLMTVDSF